MILKNITMFCLVTFGRLNFYCPKSKTIGAEMFERDNQAALTQYLTNEIDRKALDTLVRLWNNYPTDYEPIV
ncbi:MAG: iron-regulated protein, partial [Candidatus Marinimicrobia bacterium]|nr:iron-regulated protein [Candidatus Neomarinimicrobiota bacterium]